MKLRNPFRANPDQTRRRMALETEMELIHAEHGLDVMSAHVGQLRLTLARLRTELENDDGQD